VRKNSSRQERKREKEEFFLFLAQLLMRTFRELFTQRRNKKCISSKVKCLAIEGKKHKSLPEVKLFSFPQDDIHYARASKKE
jgi:hypothetical protein